MNNKTFRYIAATCFAFLAIWQVINDFYNGISFRYGAWNYYIVCPLVCGLLSLGLYTSKSSVSAVGSGLYSLGNFILFVSNLIDAVDFYGFRGIFEFSAFPTSAARVLIALIACLSFAELSFKERPQKKLTVAAESPAISNSDTGNIEKLTKLKELLDNGIITQEEFNNKKKQILGL